MRLGSAVTWATAKEARPSITQLNTDEMTFSFRSILPALVVGRSLPELLPPPFFHRKVRMTFSGSNSCQGFVIHLLSVGFGTSSSLLCISNLSASGFIWTQIHLHVAETKSWNQTLTSMSVLRDCCSEPKFWQWCSSQCQPQWWPSWSEVKLWCWTLQWALESVDRNWLSAFQPSSFVIPHYFI